VVTGIGPAGPELLSGEARAAIDAVATRFVRTERHPAAGAVEARESFDSLYESCASFEEAYRHMAERLVEAASAEGTVLYAVPGSPMVAERSVELLLADPRVEVELVPGMSFLELVWARLGIDPLQAGVQLLDGPSFPLEAAGREGPFVVGQCWSPEVLSLVKLALDACPQAADCRVTVLQRLGLASESVRSVPLAQLDREVEPDHLTSLFVPKLRDGVAAEAGRLDELVRTLRERCPWDRRQTHQSLVRHLIEEAYEVVDAIGSLDGSPGSYGHLEEELGDLLFQVCFHSVLAAEQGQFELADVARSVHDKLVARHPHLFGDLDAPTAEAVMANWEQIKKKEKGRASLMDGIPDSLPSTVLAQKVLRKAATVGLRPAAAPGEPGTGPPSGPVAPVGGGSATEGGTVEGQGGALDAAAEEEVGELLLSVVELARIRGVDAEAALRVAARRVRQRFVAAEALAGEKGADLSSMSPQEAAELWEEACRSTR
jgi:tetrapyrrole methylase family protein/MazG family protein